LGIILNRVNLNRLSEKIGVMRDNLIVARRLERRLTDQHTQNLGMDMRIENTNSGVQLIERSS
jgi:hypothetical protein